MFETAEIEILKDAILQLEPKSPGSALNLTALTLNRMPDDSWFKERRSSIGEYIKQMSGNVLTARHDGTTERLNAIVHGRALSLKYDLPFKFSWATDVGSIHNDLISIDNNLPSYFSETFIEQHYITFDEMKKYKLSSQSPTPAEYISGLRYSKLLKPAELQHVLQSYCNLVGPERFNDAHLIRKELNQALSEVFSSSYHQEFKRLDAIVSKQSVGIHYRGGDVIFGISRHEMNGVWGKSFALPAVEKLIQENQKRDVIIFGTPLGDTKDELFYLKEKYSNVSLSLKFLEGDFDGVVIDSYIMSLCRQLYSAGNTGVAVLANLFNPKLLNSQIAPQQYFDTLKSSFNESEGSDYKPLQRSFINIQLYLLAKSLKRPSSECDLYLENVKTLDPENRLEWQ